MSGAKRKPISIAIVDDDQSLLISIARNLSIAGFKVETFKSAEEYLASNHNDCDLLIVDLRLSGISGVDLSTDLSRSGICTPILFMTGHNQQETAWELQSIGSPACLRKPFTAKELRYVINRLLLIQ